MLNRIDAMEFFGRVYFAIVKQNFICLTGLNPVQILCLVLSYLEESKVS